MKWGWQIDNLVQASIESKNQSKTFQQLVAHDQTFLFKCLIDNNFDFKLGGFSSATSKLTNNEKLLLHII